MSGRMKDDGAGSASTPEEPFGTPDLEAQSEFYNEINDPFSRRYTAPQGQRMAAVKAAAQRAYETLKYSGDWYVEDPAGPEQAAADAGIVQQFASSLFPAIYTLAVTKCFSVYEARLEQDTDEARLERERYDRLKASVDVEAYAAESIRRTAKRFYDRWLHYATLDRAKEVAGEIIDLVDDYVVAAAFSSLAGEVPIEASHEERNEAFRQRIPELSDEAFRFFYVTFVDGKADDLVNYLNSAEMPFEELRAWAGVTWLEGRAFKPGTGLLEKAVPALSMHPIQAIDRAARRLQKWDVASEGGPVFFDPNSRHLVTYGEEDLSLAKAQAAVRAMSVRTADVWRWTTALIFANWDEGASEPQPVWIDAREMCDALGFKKHKHGGHRRENVAAVVTALRNLTRFRVELALGSKVYPRDPATGRRTARRVIERDINEVLLVTGTDEVRFVVDGEYLPLRLEVTPGGWIKGFPRQFAPLFKALVELPGNNKADLWAKALGTELTWQYRQDGGRTKVQRVRTMLKQAGVLDEALRVSSKLPIKEIFDNAMGIIRGLGVCASWKYNEDDLKKVSFKTHGEFGRGAFKAWLEVRVEAVPPPEIAQAMAKLAWDSKRRRKNP
jgi:hypothetical protein